MRTNFLNRARNTISNEGRPTDIVFTGPLILHGDPVENKDAATKGYVDNLFINLNADNIKSGTLSAMRLPSFTGDVTNVAGSNVFTLNPTGVTAGTYKKVTVDAKGRIVGSSALTASDVPDLNWNKITKNKPTTLTGYGIIDAVNLNGDSLPGWLKSTATPTQDMHAVTKQYVETAAAASGGTVEPGFVIPYSTSVTPGGYLRCNGGEVSKTVYATLYSVIGDKYGYQLTPGSGRPWEQQYLINSAQSGNISGWASSTALPVALAWTNAAVTKDRVHVVGGTNDALGASSNKVYTAVINADGTLGAWSTGTNLPGGINATRLIVTKNRIYAICGNVGTLTFDNVVYTAPINANGTLGTWTSVTGFPINNVVHHCFVTKNRIYVFGGANSETGYLNTGYTAPINSDGTIGTWTATTNLAVKRGNGGVIVTKNRVYLLGGCTGPNLSDVTYLSTIITAPINDDGTLGAWVSAGNLPTAIANMGIIVTKNTAYIFGGLVGEGSVSNLVYRSTINADGTLGSWVVSTNLAAVLHTSSFVGIQNRVYCFGGADSSIPTSAVRYATFTGGSNDYSSYYDGSFVLVAAGKFRLPDFTSKETGELKYYIKY